MSTQLPELDVTITNRTRWGRPIMRVNTSITYRLDALVGRAGTGKARLLIRVPAGYETDLASIPCFLWPLLSPWGRWRRAAVLHDFLCDVWPRFMADSVFRHVMHCDGVPVITRCVMYYAVRAYAVVVVILERIRSLLQSRPSQPPAA